jgi:hypothetical protein
MHSRLKPGLQLLLAVKTARLWQLWRTGLRQLAEARKFVAERKFACWVQHQSQVNIIAPTPGAIVDQATGVAGPDGVRSSRYKWVLRTAKRWGGTKCMFGIGEQLAGGTSESKVDCQCLGESCQPEPSDASL